MNSILLFISGPEIMVVMLIVVMLFGTDKIPEIARGLGQGIRQLKEATNDIKKEIKDSSEEVQGLDTGIVKDINKDIHKELNEVKDNISEITGPVKRKL
ncbi:MAG: Sec-independent protein translocase subunit TatA/TatB [Polaribacter sp.]